MLKEERHKTILNEVALHNRVLLTDIAENLDVSIDTIRRDVKELDAENKLRKVHGGAIALGFINNSVRNANIYRLEDKVAIAKKAIKLLKNDNVILIDGGTTCVELATQLPDQLSLTCFTLSLPVALELLKKPKVEVIFIGGQLSKDAQISIGANAVHNLSNIKVDYGFIGTGYVDPVFGLTEFDYDIVQVKKAVINASKKTILLSISEKLNSQHRYKTCDVSAIDTIITELDADDILLKSLKNQNIQLL
ncbi:DeoR/GlpR family transcriptional regulator of sugar metabolism [Saonia flava]|uniref:DeoR/GlpR family transcriptional regulator of sugar metabolism n=1 Tax=Saonia flava TaxID=523696 RepID=A0A846QZ96_9FLAO|nr:DeoR/GlpR family DNA-binding transcription regulator [Saonia flava]NJB72250.1 DeoR/GlpR family transcriptional regulator of sugar metabolism [Saonia flava]